MHFKINPSTDSEFKPTFSISQNYPSQSFSAVYFSHTKSHDKTYSNIKPSFSVSQKHKISFYTIAYYLSNRKIYEKFSFSMCITDKRSGARHRAAFIFILSTMYSTFLFDILYNMSFHINISRKF